MFQRMHALYNGDSPGGDTIMGEMSVRDPIRTIPPILAAATQPTSHASPSTIICVHGGYRSRVDHHAPLRQIGSPAATGLALLQCFL
jgi:hypothetical protein